MTPELVVRGLAGGTIVSIFALLGDVLTPKSFAGLFGAAPSVALASLALTFHTRGAAYVATEAQWMTAGAVAFAGYAWLVCRILQRGRLSVRLVSTLALVVWFVLAFGLHVVIGGHRS